jgi:hypothetical protein
MDRSALPYPDTPAQPTTKRPWTPPLLTTEYIDNTAHKPHLTYDEDRLTRYLYTGPAS